MNKLDNSLKVLVVPLSNLITYCVDISGRFNKTHKYNLGEKLILTSLDASETLFNHYKCKSNALEVLDIIRLKCNYCMFLLHTVLNILNNLTKLAQMIILEIKKILDAINEIAR